MAREVRVGRTMWVAWAILGLVCGGQLMAQHAKPAYRTLPAAEVIRLYWTDASNDFKTVRSATPHDTEANGLYSTVRYDLVAVPQGVTAWDEDGLHPLVSEKRGKLELRAGRPQLDLATDIARLPTRAAAQKLFTELRAVVQALPGAQPRGEQEPYWISVGIKARPGRRMLVLQLGDEPEEDGTYAIFLTVGANQDDPMYDGAGGGRDVSAP